MIIANTAIFVVWIVASFGRVDASGDAEHFTYNNVIQWEQNFPQCGSFARQSPINLNHNSNAESSDTADQVQFIELVNNNASTPVVDTSSWMSESTFGGSVVMEIVEGEGMSVDMASLGYQVTVANKSYHTWQFHFHTPGEHHLNGQFFPMGAHFVSSTPDGGELVVIGVFFELVTEDRANEKSAFIDSVISVLNSGDNGSDIHANSTESTSGDKRNTDKEQQLSVIYRNTTMISPGKFMKDELNGLQGELSTYAGSLTAPPCTENVEWFVYHRPIPISLDQWNAMKSFLRYNSRAVVPRYENGRKPTQFFKFGVMSQDKQNEFIGNGWGYDGLNGPYVWADYFPVCGYGKKQSPIDLTLYPQLVTVNQDRNALLTYQWGILKSVPIVKSDRYGVRIVGINDMLKKRILDAELQANSSSATPNRQSEFKYSTNDDSSLYEEDVVPPSTIAEFKEYVLDSVVVHTVSEHRLNGSFYPMEVQFVHHSEYGNQRLIVSFFFEITKTPPSNGGGALSSTFQFMDKSWNSPNINSTVELNLLQFSQHLQQTDLYVYEGSMTEPPCEENVKWYVAVKPMEVSEKDWKIAASILNNRPVMARDV